MTATAAAAPAEGEFRIGAGAGFAGDRIDPADDLARLGSLDALAFECLAERTIGVAQQARQDGTGEGYDPRLLRRLRGTLPHLLPRGGVVTTNAGAADPVGATRAVRGLLGEIGLEAPIAAITGDDVLGSIDRGSSRILGTDDSLADLGDRVVSANAYLGAGPILDALDAGARIVVTGRCSDAALFVAPLAHHFGWRLDDREETARASLVGHLLECAGQLTGGYFADADRKRVDGLAHLGFPMADVRADGSAVYHKLPGSGGLLDRRTVLEQLLYEIDDPGAYLTPDATVDFREVSIREEGAHRVRVDGARAAGIPATLKVSVGVRDGLLAIAEIAYAGAGCVARSDLAAEIVLQRWAEVHGRDPGELTVSTVGLDASRPWWSRARAAAEPQEVQLRISLRTVERVVAVALAEEVEALYTNGPFGGGGVSTSIRSTIGIVSTLVPRELVEPRVELL